MTRYVRFVINDLDDTSGVPAGPFGPAITVCKDLDAPEEDRRALNRLLGWFDKHLPRPDRFNRSKSKGAWRKNTKGIAWFKDSAHEHIDRCRQMATILERHGYKTTMLKDRRPGYVVYEDQWQVIAEPFADTQLR